jgi:hypothetical protein
VSNQIVITSGTKPNGPVDVSGKTVVIAGNQCLLDLTGKCTELKVIGRGHKVKMEEAASVIVSGTECEVNVITLGKAALSGTGNRLTWTKAPQGGEPQIVFHGQGNQARRG